MLYVLGLINYLKVAATMIGQPEKPFLNFSRSLKYSKPPQTAHRINKSTAKENQNSLQVIITLGVKD